MRTGMLGKTIRMAIKSHEDHDLLRYAVSCGEKLSFRLGSGIIDYNFEKEAAKYIG